jgi:lambda repressor-like predicted transcriptional regulator
MGEHMEPIDIKAAIAKAGTSQAAIAEYLGVGTSCVGKVVNKMGRSTRVERELEKITGKPIYDAPAVRGRKKLVWKGRVAA